MTMYHPVRRKMCEHIVSVILLVCISTQAIAHPRAFDVQVQGTQKNLDESFDNNVIDFDDEYSLKYNKKFDTAPWQNKDDFNKDSYRYTIVKNRTNITDEHNISKAKNHTVKAIDESTESPEFSVIPLELVSTTENTAISVVESTTEVDLTVIPLSTTRRTLPDLEINQTVFLPVSTQSSEDYTPTTEIIDVSTKSITYADKTDSTISDPIVTTPKSVSNGTISDVIAAETIRENNTNHDIGSLNGNNRSITEKNEGTTTVATEVLKLNSSDDIKESVESTESTEEEVPVFTELDTDVIGDTEVPEDYYDSKDIVPTTAPKTDALSVIFGFAGSVVESVVETVAERVVPNWIYDIYKRMQRQSEALEAEKLRSREENGGLGQFGRGILKTISSGISKPFSQLMAGVRDIGSLDSDRGFINSLASGVTSVANVANSVLDTFKDRVQAIYPGTVWCGDGRSAAARSGELGLFFFTDTCCRQHDACKIYIKAGETKYGLTNTGLFTRSHCSCDAQFRECLHKTNSLISAQIGLTYFNVLGPQCFRKAHPIVKCVRRTRITGQKCEEYELDYTKPKMWQWFDTETF